MSLNGKGYYVWKIKDCEGGDAAAVVALAQAAGLSHVVVKILDGQWAYNQRPYYVNGVLHYADDIIQPWVSTLKAAGLQVWGFQYVYLNSPQQEAMAAAARVNALGLDGFYIDAETECKGKPGAAAQYASVLKANMVKPVALASYRYPSMHPEFPFKEFLTCCQYVAPQVYWEQAVGANQGGLQLRRSLQEYRKFTQLPFIPAGCAYPRGTWAATPEQVQGFMEVAEELQMPAFNFWVWHWARRLPGVWDAVADFSSTPPAPPKACQVCGYALQDDWLYCPKDGTLYVQP